MDKEAAKSLVEETLGKPFDKERYTDLVRNILNRFEEKTFDHRGSFIYKDFADSIHRFQRIGEYENGGKKINILIVYLKKATSLERARSKQRNFVAKWLKQGREGSPKDAALVAFVPPDNKDWRFSFVKMEYRFDEEGEIIEEFTPARRYSFLVGENENSHTAQSCLLPLLQQDDQDPTLGQLEEAFSVERVTKEFFVKYRELYLRLKESLKEIVKKDSKVKADFEEKNIKSDDSDELDGLGDFAKKLLGQIIFLYFLQKKGWFGVKRGEQWGSGSRHFLRKLFKKDHRDYKNFFNDILEPLFYEALRVERSKDYYKYFDCRIPFLNGGLFDPMNEYDWVNTEILIPDTIFSNNRKTNEGTGDGILDIFDRYNFTVKEDEPLEREVAVDPEMLGKVFENLLAVGDRKDLGTYYTPREIVHYMCQESLVNYLTTELVNKVSKEDINTLVKHGEQVLEHDSRIMKKGKETKDYSFKLPGNVRKHAEIIDQKLETIQICDPAVGSGAFIVGMMNEIIGIRKALTPYLSTEKRSAYQFKQHAIQHCLYGVDIAPGAVEITKLRLWLSLVVDEKDRETIQPLPNLDFKIMQGNGLVSKFMELDFDDLGGGHLFTNDTIKKLEIKKHEYLNETSKSKKDNLKSEIENLMISICEDHITSAGTTPGFDLGKFKSQLHDSFSKNKVKQFFPWKLYFAEVFQDDNSGFDIVIANPPYRQLQGMRNNPVRKDYRAQNYETYAATGDIYCLFYERGIQIICKGGTLCYISSNKWMKARYGKLLRNFFLEYNPLLLINLGPDVFETATVDTNIFVLSKDTNQDCLRGLTFTQQGNDDIANQVAKDAVNLSRSHLNGQIWTISSEAEFNLKTKIESIGKPLKEWDVSIYRGIITGCNEAFIIDSQKCAEILAACKTDKERQRTEKIIKPVLRGRDIKRYAYQWAEKWIIVTGYDLNILKEYPAVYQHLETIGKQIKAGNIKAKGKGLFNRDDQGLNWWNLRACAYYPEFEKEKVVWPNMTKFLPFLYDDEAFYTNQKCFIITGQNIKYLCGIFNSKVASNWIKDNCPELQGGTRELSKIFFENIPIPVVAKQNIPAIGKIGTIVEKILAITKTDDYFQSSTKQNKVHGYERKIDQLVYKLYDLTDEEIKIVEQSNK